MVYFFYGDSNKASDKAKALADSLLKKKPDASLFVIDEENCNKQTLQEMTQSSALFQNKYIVRIKNSLNDDILDFLKDMKESDNLFIWNEGEVKKSYLKKIEKVSEKVVEMVVSSQPSTGNTKNIFGICDPIILRDKQKLWIKYRELLKDFAIEELHGTMFWQFKNIAISFKASQKESGLAPFSYSQAKKAQSKYEEKEVLEKCSELSKIVHEARSGGPELEIALEKFILEL